VETKQIPAIHLLTFPGEMSKR